MVLDHFSLDILNIGLLMS